MVGDPGFFVWSGTCRRLRETTRTQVLPFSAPGGKPRAMQPADIARSYDAIAERWLEPHLETHGMRQHEQALGFLLHASVLECGGTEVRRKPASRHRFRGD